MKHFWIDIDGEVFDPSYTQYEIGKTKLPDHSLGKQYKTHLTSVGTLNPGRVKPIMKQTFISLIVQFPGDKKVDNANMLI